MPQLPEHLSKHILARFGVPVGEFAVAASAEESAHHAAQAGRAVIVKALVPAAGRFKAGAVLRADTPAQARDAFTTVTAVEIDGMRASSVLISPFLYSTAEYYLAVALNTALAGPEVLLGGAGGVDIEQDDSVQHVPLRANGTVPSARFRRAAHDAGIPQYVAHRLSKIADAIAHAYLESDALLVELNPIGACDGELVSLDARIIVDDNALIRQPEIARLAQEMSPRREEDVVRQESQIEYLRLTGPIGLISGGAGLTMAMIDAISDAGSSAGCFIDCSGNPTRSGYGRALELVSGDDQIKVILVNIFGGLTRVDSVARTLVGLIDQEKPSKPIVIRLMGTNVQSASEILTSAGLQNQPSFEDALNAAMTSLKSLQSGGRE